MLTVKRLSLRLKHLMVYRKVNNSFIDCDPLSLKKSQDIIFLCSLRFSHTVIK